MPKAPKKAKLNTVLLNSPKESGWHYVAIPTEVGEQFGKRGSSRRVICTINGSETFPCALMPYDGEFTIVVSKERRARLAVSSGDKLKIELVEDQSEYGMPMPEELQEVLNQDSDGRKAFDALLPGKQRSIMHQVAKPKDVDRRIHIALVFIEHIKRNEGKIVYEEITRELKRPII